VRGLELPAGKRAVVAVGARGRPQRCASRAPRRGAPRRRAGDDPERCAAAGIPSEVGFATKPAPAASVITRAVPAEVLAGWATVFSGRGQDTAEHGKERAVVGVLGPRLELVGRRATQPALSRRRAQGAQHDLPPHRLAHRKRIWGGGNLGQTAVGQHSREPPAGPRLRQRSLQDFGQLPVQLLVGPGRKEGGAVVQLETGQATAGMQLAHQCVDRVAERGPGEVHQHPLGAHQVEGGSRQRRVGEIGVCPGEVGVAGAGAAGGRDQVGVHVHPDDLEVRVVACQAGGFQPDAAAGVLSFPRFAGVLVICEGRDGCDGGRRPRTRRARARRVRLGCGVGCTSHRCSGSGRARPRAGWRTWCRASRSARS
jgi:hypothetical protein